MNNSIQKNIEAINNVANKKGSFNFKDIHVFTMPKGTKKVMVAKNGNADNAKKTGFIILIFGSLFLILILATSYYYFVMKPGNVNNIIENTTADQSQVVTEGQKEDDSIVVNKNQNDKEGGNTKSVVEEKIIQINDIDKEKINSTGAEDDNMATETKDNEVSEDSVNIIEQEVVPVKISMIDVDEDGLFSEEELVVGTNDSSPDTDNDGYSDLAEMLSGYNPLGGGLIGDNKNFKKFTNNQYHFSFYYPGSFEITSNTNDTIIIDLGNEEFFQFFIEANKNKLSIEDWYKKQFGVNVVNPGLIFEKDNWTGIREENGESIFFKNNRDDYVIAYNYSSKDYERYPNIFEIVFNTFKILN